MMNPIISNDMKIRNMRILGFRAFLISAFKDFSQSNVPKLAASVSYYALLAIAPVLFIVTLIVRTIFGRFDEFDNPLSPLEGLVPPDVLRYLRSITEGTPDSSGEFLTLLTGIVILILAAGALMNALQYSMNVIWNVKIESRAFHKSVAKRLINVLILSFVGILLPALTLLSIIANALHGQISQLFPFMTEILPWLQFLVPLLALSLFFALLIRYIPDVKLVWFDVWIGASITAALFVIGQFVIGLYFRYADVASAQGAAGSLVAFLIWVYYSAQVFLFGAVCTKVYSESHGTKGVPEPGTSYHKSVTVKVKGLSPFQKAGTVFKTVMTEIKLAKFALWIKSLPSKLKKMITKS